MKRHFGNCSSLRKLVSGMVEYSRFARPLNFRICSPSISYGEHRILLTINTSLKTINMTGVLGMLAYVTKMCSYTSSLDLFLHKTNSSNCKTAYLVSAINTDLQFYAFLLLSNVIMYTALLF